MKIDIVTCEEIAVARAAFLDAVKAEAEATDQLREKRLDVAIAKREGKEQIAQDFEAEAARMSTEVWYPAYKARQDKAAALCAAISVDPKSLKDAIQ